MINSRVTIRYKMDYPTGWRKSTFKMILDTQPAGKMGGR